MISLVLARFYSETAPYLNKQGCAGIYVAGIIFIVVWVYATWIKNIFGGK